MNVDSGRVWRTLKSFKNFRLQGCRVVSAEVKRGAVSALEELCRSAPVSVLVHKSSVGPLHPGYADLSLRSAEGTRGSVGSNFSVSPTSNRGRIVCVASLLSELNSEVIKPIIYGKLVCSVRSIRNKSAHNPDCLGSDFIKGMPLKLRRFLLRLFNKIFNLESFPFSWKEYFVIVIPKVWPNRFRPISLSNMLF